MPHCINCQLLASCIQLLLSKCCNWKSPCRGSQGTCKGVCPDPLWSTPKTCGIFSKIILQVGLDIDDDSPCSYFHTSINRGFHRHGANPQMDGWKIPNQTWMITGGTHGYPYDLENPHHLPYIIIFHIFSLDRLGANSVDSSVKIHPGKSAEAREGSCPSPHVLRSTNGNSARCCDRQRLGHGPASMLKTEGNLDGISMNVLHSHGKWSISFDLPICEITRMVRVAFNFL